MSHSDEALGLGGMSTGWGCTLALPGEYDRMVCVAAAAKRVVAAVIATATCFFSLQKCSRLSLRAVD